MADGFYNHIKEGPSPTTYLIFLKTAIALVADTIHYGTPLIMGVTSQVANTLISLITSRLRACL
jgi:hypothetical protein